MSIFAERLRAAKEILLHGREEERTSVDFKKDEEGRAYVEMRIKLPKEIVNMKPSEEIMPTGEGNLKWQIVKNYSSWMTLRKPPYTLKIIVEEWPGWPWPYGESESPRGGLTEVEVSDAIQEIVDNRLFSIGLRDEPYKKDDRPAFGSSMG